MTKASLSIFINILILLFLEALILASYRIGKRAYKDNRTDFLVPKVFGFGVGINPNHQIGQLIYKSLFIGINSLLLILILLLMVRVTN